MKQLNILLLALLCCSLLLSCGDDKEEENAPSIADKFEGNWTKSLIRLQYFDASGNMEHEIPVTEENGVINEFKDGSFKATFPRGNPYTEQATYKVFKRDGKDYVELTNGTDKKEYEVITISDTRLIWQRDYIHTFYYNPTGKRADKAMYIEEFTK